MQIVLICIQLKVEKALKRHILNIMLNFSLDTKDELIKILKVQIMLKT